MSKLLLNEQPLLVMPQLAKKIGLNESLVLQQIHYWNEINKKANNNFRGGYHWTFNSYESWTEQFPFWSKNTIARTIANLEEIKLVVSGNYNKLKIDRTKWYRIDYDVLNALETFETSLQSPFTQIGVTRVADWVDHLTKLGLPLPETNSETNPETTAYAFLAKSEHWLQAYGRIHKQYTGRYHKRISNNNVDYILSAIEKLRELDIDDETWIKATEEHFQYLPKNNDGDILSFLKATMRYFEIDNKLIS